MFLKRCERRKNGKKHTYWALVESYRTPRGSRQRVVAYLGESEPKRAKRLGATGPKSLGQATARQPSLFDPPHYDDPSRRRAGAGRSERRSPGAAARLRRRVDGLGAVAAVGAGHALAESA